MATEGFALILPSTRLWILTGNLGLQQLWNSSCTGVCTWPIWPKDWPELIEIRKVREHSPRLLLDITLHLLLPLQPWTAIWKSSSFRHNPNPKNMLVPVTSCVSVPWGLHKAGGIPSVLELPDSKLASKIPNYQILLWENVSCHGCLCLTETNYANITI